MNKTRARTRDTIVPIDDYPPKEYEKNSSIRTTERGSSDFSIEMTQVTAYFNYRSSRCKLVRYIVLTSRRDGHLATGKAGGGSKSNNHN